MVTYYALVARHFFDFESRILMQKDEGKMADSLEIRKTINL